MLRFLSPLFHNDRGTTAIEYTIIAAFIAVVVVSAVGLMGDSISNTFNDTANSL